MIMQAQESFPISLFLFILVALLILVILLDTRAPTVNASEESEINKGPEIVNNPKLKIEPVSKGLPFSTGMAFIGLDDILFIEKGTGKVRRIVDGELLDKSILDVNVANKAERGLLGITVTKNDNGDPLYVFLYFTESASNRDGNETCDTSNYCTSGNPIGHRLYKYEYHNNKLINPQLILDLPANPGAVHLGGVITVGPDNNVYVITGDGDSCEFKSCEDGIAGRVIDAQTANVKDGITPAGRGGIIRVTQDGGIVGNGKGIFRDEYPLNMYYSYGIRNSFGMDFDPVTGNLWDTENGPAFGDEINLVEPGFNSGWIKAQGVWPLNGYSLLDDNQTFSGYVPDREISGEPEGLFYFNKNAKYSNPEFTWNLTVGPTAIEFFNSDKLGKKYENDIFVGDFNNGNLYHFDLNKNRTALDLRGPLKDKIAGNLNELQGVIFAKKFGGGIIDIETGSDGYLYILSGDSSIYRISDRS